MRKLGQTPVVQKNQTTHQTKSKETVVPQAKAEGVTKPDPKPIADDRQDEVTLDGNISLEQFSSLSGRPAVGNASAIQTGSKKNLAATEFTIDNLTHSLPKISTALKFDSTRSKMVAREIVDNLKPQWNQLFPTTGRIAMEGKEPVIDIPAAQTGKGFIFNGHPLKMVADAVGLNFKPGDKIDEAMVRDLTKSVLTAVRKYPTAKTTVDAILGQSLGHRGGNPSCVADVISKRIGAKMAAIGRTVGRRKGHARRETDGRIRRLRRLDSRSRSRCSRGQRAHLLQPPHCPDGPI